MLECGFSDEEDYIEHLVDDAVEAIEKRSDYAREDDENIEEKEYGEWLNALPDEDLEEMNEVDILHKRQNEREEQQYQKETISTMKVWASEHPQSARLFRSKIQGDGWELVDDLSSNRFFESLYQYKPSSLSSIFQEWQNWLETNEAYNEFKTKTPKEWNEFKNESECQTIQRATELLLKNDANYNIDEYSEAYWDGHRYWNCHPTYPKKNATLTARIIVNKWIADHTELWRHITETRKDAIKTDDQYLYQYWLETYSWRDSYATWAIMTPNSWRQLHEKLNNITDSAPLLKEWQDSHKDEFDEWKSQNLTVWNQFYDCRKTILWYAFVEVAWEKWEWEKWEKEQAQKKALHEKNEEVDDNEVRWHTAEEIAADLADDDPYEDDYSIGFDHPKEKWEKLLPGDPRAAYKCKNNKEEDSIAYTLIKQYREMQSAHPEKELFVKNNCSTYDFTDFVKREDPDATTLWWESHKYNPIEESPEQFADRKLLDFWMIKHKRDWQKWALRHIWEEKIRHINYSPKEYFEAWKRLNSLKWDNWVKNSFAAWKQDAANIDMWFSWFYDKNEQNFSKWAFCKLRNWHYYMRMALQATWDSIEEDYGINKQGELLKIWRHPYLDLMLLHEFAENRLGLGDIAKLPYKPEYKKTSKIKETLYKHKARIDVFHNDRAMINVEEFIVKEFIIDDDIGKCEYVFIDKSKSGFINKKGEIVIEPRYDEASDFINGYAATKERYEYLYENPDSGEIESSKRNWGIINTDGVYMIPPIYDRINLYDNGIIIYAKGGSLVSQDHITGSRFGIMDFHFKHLTSCKYSYCRLMKTGLIAASVTNNGLRRWGLLNTSGQEITDFKYSAIYNTSRRLMYANTNSIWDEDDYVFYEGEWGTLDATGKEIGPFIPARDLDDYISRKDEQQ